MHYYAHIFAPRWRYLRRIISICSAGFCREFGEQIPRLASGSLGMTYADVVISTGAEPKAERSGEIALSPTAQSQLCDSHRQQCG